MNILAVAAHPDDEVLGMGGTIARLVKEGHRVSIAIMGIRHLGGEAREVADLFGVKCLLTDHLKDQRFDSPDLLDLVCMIDLYLLQCQPEVVYTHHTGDLNLDHALTARAVLTATRPKPGCTVKEVYMFEVPSSTEWGFHYAFKPNVFMEIGDTLETKWQAMELYTSERRKAPHPRSPHMIRATAYRWGSVVGMDAAEAFELVRSIR